MRGLDAYCAICGGSTRQIDVNYDNDAGGKPVEGFEYDRDILGGADLQWFKTIHVSGFNPHTTGREKYAKHNRRLIQRS